MWEWAPGEMSPGWDNATRNCLAGICQEKASFQQERFRVLRAACSLLFLHIVIFVKRSHCGSVMPLEVQAFSFSSGWCFFVLFGDLCFDICDVVWIRVLIGLSCFIGLENSC